MSRLMNPGKDLDPQNLYAPRLCSFSQFIWALLLCVAGMTANASAADGTGHWPQWRGPLANGISPDGNPPTTWSESKNVKWKIKLPGSGTGTPIIWGDQIFVQVAVPTGKKLEPVPEPKKTAMGIQPMGFGLLQAPQEGAPPGEGRRRRPPGGPGGGGGRGSGKPTEVHQFALLSIDRATGDVQWRKVAREEVPHEGHHRDHGFASHSPVTDGEHVYSWFGSRGLHCYNLKGELKWSKEFGKIQSANGFGEGSSPALHGNTIIVNWDHEGEDFVAALDKATGKELWRNPRNERTTWTTPFIVEHGGKTEVIIAASQRIRSYDIATGQQLWECGGLTSNVIPTPVSGFDLLFAVSGHRGDSLLAIKLGRTGDLTDTDAIVWRRSNNTPYVPSPLLYGERLYCTEGNDAILSCFKAKTGDVLIDGERLTGPSGFYASLVGADNRVYLVGRNGTSLVLKNADKLEILATNKLDDKFDASPAIVGKQMFLRGHEHLYCLAE